MIAYYSSAFGDSAQQFSYFLLETVIIESTIMSFVCFIQDAGYDVANLFLPDHLWACTDNGRLRANKEMLVPLLCKMRANTLNRGLLLIISDCATDWVADVLVFACAFKIEWTVLDCLGRFLDDSADAKIILVFEWQATRLQRERRGATLSGAVHAKGVP